MMTWHPCHTCRPYCQNWWGGYQVALAGLVGSKTQVATYFTLGRVDRKWSYVDPMTFLQVYFIQSFETMFIRDITYRRTPLFSPTFGAMTNHHLKSEFEFDWHLGRYAMIRRNFQSPIFSYLRGSLRMESSIFLEEIQWNLVLVLVAGEFASNTTLKKCW